MNRALNAVDSRRTIEIASVARLRSEIETVPAVRIEDAAELLKVSVRTLYRRRSEFEHKRQNRHLFFTVRSIKQYIEIEQYQPTASFDVTMSANFDNFAKAIGSNQE